MAGVLYIIHRWVRSILHCFCRPHLLHYVLQSSLLLVECAARANTIVQAPIGRCFSPVSA